MIQFFIAYYFLHRYIFVPAYEIIHKKDILMNDLESKIFKLQISMAEQSLQNQKNWHAIQKNLLKTVASKKSKDLASQCDQNAIDLSEIVCELNDVEAEKGQQFLQKTLLHFDKVQK
jgi:hypothetical protein